METTTEETIKQVNPMVTVSTPGQMEVLTQGTSYKGLKVGKVNGRKVLINLVPLQMNIPGSIQQIRSVVKENSSGAVAILTKENIRKTKEMAMEKWFGWTAADMQASGLKVSNMASEK